MSVVLGMMHWEGGRDDQDGHRDYWCDWLIQQSVLDGPYNAMNTPGLPAIGAPWTFGLDNDSWAFCHPQMRAVPYITKEKGEYFVVSQYFSTRPIKRCQDTQVENPLSEPPRLSGSYVKFLKEAQTDRNGKALMMTSHERIRGASVEFDEGRHNVRVGITQMNLGLDVWTPLLNNVNDAPLWGLTERKIKFSSCAWTRLLYGTCSFFYELEMDFEIDFEGFDREVASEGTRCLAGWMPGSSLPPVDPDAIDFETGEPKYKNPKYFEVYKDLNGENSRTFLDEKGKPVFTEDEIYYIDVEKYEEDNLLVLGIPSSL